MGDTANAIAVATVRRSILALKQTRRPDGAANGGEGAGTPTKVGGGVREFMVPDVHRGKPCSCNATSL